MKKDNLYKFRFETAESNYGFTDYGTKEEMKALFNDANERMKRFGGKQNITLKGAIEYSEDMNRGNAVYNWDDFDTVYIYYEELPQFDSKSKRELSAEMNDYYNRCFK